MTIKVCDKCGKQLSMTERFRDGKYGVRLFVEDTCGDPLYNRNLFFCPVCEKKLTDLLDEFLMDRPQKVEVLLEEGY